MASVSFSTATNPFQAIQVPTVTLPYLLVKGFSLPEYEVSRFTVKVEECYKAIRKVPASTSENQQQRYLRLNELRVSIQKVLEVCPQDYQDTTRLQGWVNTITVMRQKSKKIYQTQSHHFIRTAKGFHLVKAKPSLDVAPAIRIDLNDIPGTFAQINQASPSDKVQELQNFRDVINVAIAKAEDKLLLDESQADKIDELNDALVKIVDYFDSMEGTEEIRALQVFRWKTKDEALVEEFATSLDPDGVKEVSRLSTRHDISVTELSDGLVGILRERYYSNPIRTPRSYVQLWLASWNLGPVKGVEKEVRKARIAELFTLVENSAMEDPLRLVIYDYLFNFYDPTGVLRNNYVQSLKKIDKQCLILGTIGSSRVRLGSNVDDFLKELNQDNPLVPTPADQKAIKSLLARMETESLTDKEIKLFSNILRAEAAALFLSFDMKAYFGDSTVFDHRHKPIDVFHRQFRAYFQHMMAVLPTEDKRKPLLRNLTLLAKNLVENGEFNWSFHLFLLLGKFHSDETKEKCVKEYASLVNLFNFRDNLSSLRDYMKKRTQAGLLNVPLLTFVNGDCLNLSESVKKLKADREKQLKVDLGSRAKEFDTRIQAKKKSKEPANEWVRTFDAVKALDLPKETSDPIKASLRTSLKNETLQELKIEKHMIHLYADWIALKIYYKSYQRAPETKAFMAEVAKMVPYDPDA